MTVYKLVGITNIVSKKQVRFIINIIFVLPMNAQMDLTYSNNLLKNLSIALSVINTI